METAVIQIKKLFFAFDLSLSTAPSNNYTLARGNHAASASFECRRSSRPVPTHPRVRFPPRRLRSSQQPVSVQLGGLPVISRRRNVSRAQSLICIMSLSMADNWAQRHLVSMKAPVLFWQKPERKSSPEKAALCRGGKWSRTPAVFISCNWSAIQLLCNSYHGSHITTSMSWN